MAVAAALAWAVSVVFSDRIRTNFRFWRPRFSLVGPVFGCAGLINLVVLIILTSDVLPDFPTIDLGFPDENR